MAAVVLRASRDTRRMWRDREIISLATPYELEFHPPLGERLFPALATPVPADSAVGRAVRARHHARPPLLGRHEGAIGSRRPCLGDRRDIGFTPDQS